MANPATAPSPPKGRSAAFVPTRRRFTADEYDRMIQAGIVREGERVELLEGEIIQMAAMGSRHVSCTSAFNEWFVMRLAGQAIVNVQSAVRLSSGAEPEPDIALLRYRRDRYVDALPGPEDILLLIEVSDTTLRYDRSVKLPLYAAAGIPEVWHVDLQGKRVYVCRRPQGDRYERVTIVRRDGPLSPLAFPELSLPVSEVLT